MPLPTDNNYPKKTSYVYKHFIPSVEFNSIVEGKTNLLLIINTRWINIGDELILLNLDTSIKDVNELVCNCIVKDVRNDNVKGIEKGYSLVKLIVTSITKNNK